MQYYSLAEGLRPLEAGLPTAETGILAVLAPEELETAPLPPHLHPPLPPADLRENQYCWLRVEQGEIAGQIRTPQRAGQPAHRLTSAWAQGNLLLVDHDRFAGECLGRIAQMRPHGADGADNFLVDLLLVLTRDDLMDLQQLETRLTNLEQAVLADETDKFIRQMSALRKELNRENRFYAQLADLASSLQEDAADLFDRRSAKRLGYFLRRVGNLREETQMLREYASQISSEYQAQVDITQNRVMKLLTIVTTIFLPLSLIAGWYGMNFTNMPELHWALGYPAVIFAAVLIVAGLILYFRRKKWF